VKVLVPLNNIEHLTDYLDSGAGEFYLGFHCDSWREKFGEYGDLNRLTGFRNLANPHNFEEILEIVKEGKRKQLLIFILFNSSLYSKEQLEWVETYMRRLKEVDVAGVIISCYELLILAKKIGLYTVISTIAGVYNEDIARFYQEHGADRIILPRDLSVDEIEDIVHKVPQVEYEVFMMRNGCAFSDSNCLGMHRNELRSICGSLRNSQITTNITDSESLAQDDVQTNNQLYCREFHNSACGLCSIYRFVVLGIAAAKIVGRSDEWENICIDISLVNQNVEIAKSCKSQEEYLSKMVWPENKEEICKAGLSCYYPEMRFDS
jgi:putative protease